MTRTTSIRFVTENDSGVWIELVCSDGTRFGPLLVSELCTALAANWPNEYERHKYALPPMEVS